MRTFTVAWNSLEGIIYTEVKAKEYLIKEGTLIFRRYNSSSEWRNHIAFAAGSWVYVRTEDDDDE